MLQALGITVSGTDDAWQAAADVLRKQWLFNDTEKQRIRVTRSRKELLNDGGVKDQTALLSMLFKDPGVQKAHIQLLPFTRYDNASRRINEERSTVYLQPPLRRVGNETDDAKYQRLLKEIRQDEVMRLGNLWLNALNDVLFWFRVRQVEPPTFKPVLDDDGELQFDESGQPIMREDLPPVLEPVFEVLSGEQFWAIGHPDDPTHLIAIVKWIAPRDGDSTKAHYDVWTDHHRIKINGNFKAMINTLMPNPFKRIPGHLAHNAPRQTSLLDWHSGADIVDAHRISWAINTILVQETKSVSKQAVWIGDPAGIPSGQSQRTDVDLTAGEGTGFATIDRGTDLAQFRDTADHIIQRAAANHGLPPSVLQHAGATSGFEIELRERRLRELRQQQVVNFRTIEREIVQIQDVVLAEALPAAHFNIDGWGINFADPEVPLSPLDELKEFEEEKRLGLTSTVEFMRQQDPDLLSDEIAFLKLKKNVDDELKATKIKRPEQALNGADNLPKDNGAKGPPARDEDDETEEEAAPAIN